MHSNFTDALESALINLECICWTLINLKHLINARSMENIKWHLCYLYDVINHNYTGQNYIMNMANKFLGNAKKFKCFEKQLEKIKFENCWISLDSEYPACPLLFSNLKIKAHQANE
jgi:hypothetical protein